MITFIDDHRGSYGVEPICRVLPIAPSTYHDHVAKRLDPMRMIRWRERYHDLDRKYEKYLYGDIPVIPDDVMIEQKKDWEQFAAEGLAIARAVKEQLPDWTVVYLNQFRSDTCEPAVGPMAPYEFEIGSDGGKRPLPPRRG